MGRRARLGWVGLAAWLAACASTPEGARDPGDAAAEQDLVAIPAGSFVLGHDRGPRDQRPPHRVLLDAFWLERTLVTVDAFRAFVDATGYVTSAEKRGTGKTAVLGMDDWEWREVAGLSWRAPWGDWNTEAIPLRGDMPVTMVSWLDADAYCRWRGRRLPTEAEWEYAMRAGATTRFPWGEDALPADGRPRLNHWEGRTHHENSAADGWVYLSPVRTYPPNRWGLHDPAGNVWQWVADWYSADTFARDAAEHPEGVRDPRGPERGVFKVARGGSWWCSARTCHGYGLVSRGKTRPEASFSNNGFRCAADAPSAVDDVEAEGRRAQLHGARAADEVDAEAGWTLRPTPGRRGDRRGPRRSPTPRRPRRLGPARARSAVARRPPGARSRRRRSGPSCRPA